MTSPIESIPLAAEALPATPDAWLAALPGPVRGTVAGADRSRRRVVTTLLHGNEPSGFRALHAWLRSGARPATDVHLFLGAVQAAQRGEGVRMRPGDRDLNRCFRPPWDGREGALARAMLEAIEALRPEIVLDLHNTTGGTPAYAVVAEPHERTERVATLFAPRIVHTALRIGALIEAATAPALVIECGLRANAEADTVAREGLAALLAAPDLDALPLPRLLHRIADPLRVRLVPGTRAAFGDAPAPDPSLRLPPDLDAVNFVPQPAGTTLGRVSPPAHWPLVVEDASGADRAREWFALESGALRLRRPALPLMATVDPHTAEQDCLCYLAPAPADENSG